MFFINYEKITNLVYDKIKRNLLTESDKKRIMDRVADRIADEYLKDGLTLKDISENLYVEEYSQYIGTGTRRISIGDFVGKKVSEKLVDDVYELNRAEVLKEVSGQGILQLLQEKLQESAKQQVLDYVSGALTNNKNNGR
jgi:hypothetical protein